MESLPVCLVCLIGLPASGKTALSQKLQQEFSRVNVENSDTLIIQICYDSVIPVETQKAITESFNQKLANTEQAANSLDGSSLIWRQTRKNVLRTVEALIVQFKNLPDSPVLESTDLKFMTEQILRDNPVLSSSSWKPFNKMVVIIDDNLYYRSMRYEYFQLARKYTIGFCQLFLECSKETVLLRNRSRHITVPKSVIDTMNDKLEPPLPDQNSWEYNSFTVKAEDFIEDEQLKEICAFIVHSLTNPVTTFEDTSELKDLDRRISSTNVIHQIDTVSRKIIGEMIKQNKDTISKDQLKQLSVKYCNARLQLLEDLQKKSCILPADIVESIEEGKKEVIKDTLNKLITTLISERLTLD